MSWVEELNTRNINYIIAVESLGSPFYPSCIYRGTLNLIEGFKTTSNKFSKNTPKKETIPQMGDDFLI